MYRAKSYAPQDPTPNTEFDELIMTTVIMQFVLSPLKITLTQDFRKGNRILKYYVCRSGIT